MGGDLPAVVLLHGYGADGADLLPLAAETPCRRGLRWIFPEAPQLRPGDPFGRSWFPIDEDAIAEAQQTGRAVDFSAEDPEGLAASRGLVEKALAELGLTWDRVVFGGFSQGSMVAVELALSSPVPPAGLVVLSGNLIAEKRWRELAAARPGLPFFQSHGRADPILGFRGALGLEALLREAGLKGSLMAFDGGHTIAPEVVGALAEFLDSLSLKEAKR